ncbi:PepSY domain-containing protein [Candidatus Amoebophilus asiaticus]|nr:PepSY domain-containing protein [Candidatus Amoebophilus asiaticus]
MNTYESLITGSMRDNSILHQAVGQTEDQSRRIECLKGTLPLSQKKMLSNSSNSYRHCKHQTNMNRWSKISRWCRKLHKKVAMATMMFFLLIAITGILLGLKKQFNAIQPASAKGVSNVMSNWISLDILSTTAKAHLKRIHPELSAEIKRIDIRPERGLLKYIFSGHFWEIQMCATTGKVLQMERRNHDLIEMIHDGSILDYLFNTKGHYFKMIYSTTTGIILVIMILSGLLLWLGPRRIKKLKYSH